MAEGYETISLASTIAIGQTVGPALNTIGTELLGVNVPANVEGALRFEASDDGVAWFRIQLRSIVPLGLQEVDVPSAPAQARYYEFTPVLTLAKFTRVVSSSAQIGEAALIVVRVRRSIRPMVYLERAIGESNVRWHIDNVITADYREKPDGAALLVIWLIDGRRLEFQGPTATKINQTIVDFYCTVIR